MGNGKNGSAEALRLYLTSDQYDGHEFGPADVLRYARNFLPPEHYQPTIKAVASEVSKRKDIHAIVTYVWKRADANEIQADIEPEPIEIEKEPVLYRKIQRKPGDRVFSSRYEDICFACYEDGETTEIHTGDTIVWFKDTSGKTTRNCWNHYS